jgi:hypothetical protein
VASTSRGMGVVQLSSSHSRHGTRRRCVLSVSTCSVWPRCGGRLRLLATVEDPVAIRATLAAVAVSRQLAERAPPFAASIGHQPRRDQRLSAIRAPRMPRPVRSGPERSCIPVNQFLTAPGIALTGRCPRCTWGSKRHPLTRGGIALCFLCSSALGALVRWCRGRPQP